MGEANGPHLGEGERRWVAVETAGTTGSGATGTEKLKTRLTTDVIDRPAPELPNSASPAPSGIAAPAGTVIGRTRLVGDHGRALQGSGEPITPAHQAGDASPPALPSDDAPDAADGARAPPASPRAMPSDVRAPGCRRPDARDHPQKRDRDAGGTMNQEPIARQ